MKNKGAIPELLSPAGNEDSLRAALAGGADAVYFGGSEFSNRMRAKNFTRDSIRSAVKLCHSCGAAAHITVNTRVREREIDDVLSFAEVILGGAEDERADALIVADLGVSRLIKSEFPHAVLHASTQTSMASAADCAELERLGFSRLVVPRELSFGEIAALADTSPIEIEMFIHGAHCVSCSGQCLLSFVMGGRSGNRGECAQPCRLPYSMTADGRSVGGAYPLSMADMYLGGHMTEIISSRVSSLKIEGRLKSPAYVYGVTQIYRRLLDEQRDATEKERRALEDLFTRGFTDGYFTSRYGAMAGGRSLEAERRRNIQKDISLALSERKRVFSEKPRERRGGLPVTARFTLRAGEPARLELSCGDAVSTAVGEIPAAATGAPLAAQSAAKNISKLGASRFVLSPEDIEFDMDDGLWMPVSAINELRRRAVAELESRVAAKNPTTWVNSVNPANPVNLTKPKEKCSTAAVAKIASLALLMRGGGSFDELLRPLARVYVQSGDASAAIKQAGSERGKICATLPLLLSDEETEKLLGELDSLGIVRVMCHTLGQVRLARQRGMTADVSFRANITNPYAAAVYADAGAAVVTLSPELSIGAARSIAAKGLCGVSLIGFGRLPVMHLSRCVISGGVCKKGNLGGRVSCGSAKPHACTGELRDRMGETFPVIGARDCTNTVYNSAVTWMGDRADELTLGGYAESVMFMFVDETVADAADVILAYSAREKRVGRRI